MAQKKEVEDLKEVGKLNAEKTYTEKELKEALKKQKEAIIQAVKAKGSESLGKQLIIETINAIA